MIDSSAVIPILITGGIIGFIIGLFLQGPWKSAGILFAFPFIFFLLTAVQFGMEITNPNELPSWVNWFVTNLVPFAIAFAGEGVGVKAGKWVRSKTIDN